MNKENVVYILGAGFSAPLGLPVMTNFILKAKDMYFQNTGKFSYFDEVFEVLSKLSVIKNYFSTDLYNIEEVLSILEMNDYLNGSDNSSMFKNFIKDIIEFYTPELSLDIYPSNITNYVNWENLALGDNELYRYYGTFVANLLNLRTTNFQNEIKLHWEKNKDCKYNYSIISFNYDMVLEKFDDFIHKIGFPMNDFGFQNEDFQINPNKNLISKLHGSVDKSNIVPPTWNKYSNPELKQTWENAWKMLTHANHIRILGYSLPVSDSYIRYFLKSSVYDSKHLKSIDVLTLDNTKDQEVKNRYDKFIDFNYYRFKNANIVDYLKFIYNSNLPNSQTRISSLNYDKLEEAHEKFMQIN